MNNVMIDLESLGQEPGNVIVTLSAVQFDITTGDIGKVFHESISIEDSLKEGLTIDPSTVMWWMTQNENARMQMVETQNNPDSLVEVLNKFATWLNHLPHATVRELYRKSDIVMWGRGPRFDMGLLSYAYKLIGYKKTPWDFRKERCVRTYESICPDIKIEYDKNRIGVLHNGVDDAKHEIKYVVKIQQFINNLINLDKTLTKLKD